jgi:hypothetical protein
MSIRLVSRIFEHSRATGVDRLVLIALAFFCNGKRDDNTDWLSLAKLAKMVKLAVPKLCKSLTRLDAIGEVKRQRSMALSLGGCDDGGEGRKK